MGTSIDTPHLHLIYRFLLREMKFKKFIFTTKMYATFYKEILQQCFQSL